MDLHNTNRASKGKASLRSSNGRLQARIPQPGKPIYLSLKLDDTPGDRIKAGKIIDAINLDLELERFDASNLDQYIAKRHRKTHVPKQTNAVKTLQDLWVMYVQSEDKNFGPTTIAASINPLSKKIQRIPQIKIGKDEALLLKQFDKLAITTRHNQIGRIKTCYRWGEKHGLIPAGSTDKIIVPTLEAEDGAPPDPLTDDEVAALLQLCNERAGKDLVHVIKFLLLTGCRPSEAFGVRISAIDLRKKQLCFNRTYNKLGSEVIDKQGTKTKRKRYFPINDQLHSLLREILSTSHKGKDDFLLTCNGKPWTTSLLSSYWVGTNKGDKLNKNGVVPTLVREGKLERYRTPYNLRDTYITHCIIKGISPSVVASWVGNSPSMIDKHYFAVLEGVSSPSLYS